jgi:hypothetical protein
MNVKQLIWELRNERSRLDEAILAMERLCFNRRGSKRTALRLVPERPPANRSDSSRVPNQEIRGIR